MIKGMPQGIQSHFPHVMIREYGCYFLALMRWAEIEASSSTICYTEDDILRFYNEFVNRGWMRESCYVLKAENMLNFMLGKTRYNSMYWSPKIPPTDPLYIIQLAKPGYEHYVLGNSGAVLWDSLDPNRPAAKDYVQNNYGVFVMKNHNEIEELK